jgi:uncharacterized protein HemY
MKLMFLLAEIDLSALPMDSAALATVSSVLSLIVLIVFFFLAVNVSKIKKSLHPATSDACFDMAKKYEFMHQKEKALEMYFEGIYLEIKDYVVEPERSRNREQSLQREFGEKIKELGGEWPNFEVMR